MNTPSNKNSNNKDLPISYVNPWLLLNKAIRAVLVDLKLRIKEILRLNSEGFYMSSGILPKNISVFLLPTIIISILILLVFGVFPNNLFVHLNTSLINEDSISDLPTQKTTLSKAQSPHIEDKLNQPDQSAFSVQNLNEEINKNPLRNNLSLKNELNEKLPVGNSHKDLLDIIDTNSLDNGVTIKFHNKFKYLTPEELVSIVKNLISYLKILGYERFNVVDDNGFLIARDSKFGDEIIFFKQASS